MKKTTDIFEDFENASDDIIDELAQSCTPLTSEEEKRIFSDIERKYKQHRNTATDTDSVYGVDIYRKTAWYTRFSSVAAVILVISGVIGGAVLLGTFNRSGLENSYFSVIESSSVNVAETHIEYEQILRAPFSYFPKNAVESGEMEVTIRSAELFDSFEAAEMPLESAIPFRLMEREETAIDEKTGVTTEGWKILKLHVVVENINAVTAFPNMGLRYTNDKYEFSASFTTSLKYASDQYPLVDLQPIYFSLKGKCKSNSMKYLCLPGSVTEYDIAYLVKTDDEIYFNKVKNKYVLLEAEGETK